MTVKIKICGLNTPEAIKAAVQAGASHIGFVFFEKSPRNVTAEQVADLAAPIPEGIIKTGVFVNPGDDQLTQILALAPLDLIQLHGAETPARVQEVKDRFGLPVMKAIAIAGPDDITRAKSYDTVADMLLFDAKAPVDLENALPGGNGLSFDWQLIRDTDWQVPWMLSGGLDQDNVAEALTISGADYVDVSSGVETSPGRKSLDKINAFISKVTSL
ncbi:MAG: phosphoribosylanthranilate isomerase [Alphaproteobacteria bacterium]|nr:MAG: phosphoribosylanthranilate isomerase [Alphaproteobacteria bacterium]